MPEADYGRKNIGLLSSDFVKTVSEEGLITIDTTGLSSIYIYTITVTVPTA